MPRTDVEMEKTNNVVNVNVLGRDYPVKCTESEAIELKKVEKSLNQQLNQYRLKYVQLDKQDCLSMALIENLMEKFQSQKGEVEDQCNQTIDRLEGLLAPHIS